MEKKIVIAIFVIAAFLLADWGHPLIGYEGPSEGWTYILVRTLNRSFWYILLPVLVVAFLYKPKDGLAELGLGEGFRTGAGVAFLATLPMLLGYGWMANFNVTLSWEGLILGCVLAALSEEVLYRGFLFGQLYRRVGLPFLLAALPMALFFGAGHLYQGHGFAQTAGIFAVTFIGGLWFCWLYVAWGYNLWVPVAFHFLMNLYWSVFNAGDNALGGLWPNVFRIATIALSIWLTLRRNPAAGRLLRGKAPAAEKEEIPAAG